MAISFRPLKAEEVEVRVGTCSEKGCSLLLYKDARVDMALLDEAVGPENWDCSYESIDGKLFCTVGVRCSPEGSYNDWVYKQDTGTPSNMEAQKGEASDAFKRACFKWGIGRELYTAPFVWVPSEKCNVRKNERSGRFQCFDKFNVAEMSVEDGEIVNLVICNQSRKNAVVYGVPTEDKGKPETAPQKPPGGRWAKVAALKEEAISMGIKEQGIVEWMDAKFGKPLNEFSDTEIKAVERHIEQLVKDMRTLAESPYDG